MQIWLLQTCGDIHGGNYQDVGEWTDKAMAESHAKETSNKLAHDQGLRLIMLDASIFTWIKLKLMGR